MERKWKASEWKPTKIKESWETSLSVAEIVSLREKRDTNNKSLDRHPYDPALWIKRAYTHEELRYPELAVGDAFKAELLCRNLLSDLKQNLKPNFRIGAKAGFWMRHEDPEDEYDEVPPWLKTIDLDAEHLTQEQTFELILNDAEQVKRNNLEFSPNSEEGRFVPRAYPWMNTEHSMRTDKTLDEINAALADPPVADLPRADSPIDDIDAALAQPSLHEIIAALANTTFHRIEPSPAEAAFHETDAALADSTLDETSAALADPSLDDTDWHRPAKPVIPRPTGMMVVKRYAFGSGVGARGGADLLGAFALRDIKPGELVLIDYSKTWGCTGPGKEDARYTDMDGLPAGGKAINLGGGYGCPHFMHPNQDQDVVEHDLRWVRDRLGVDAAHAILCARSFLTCVQDQVDHPLDHTLIARLTPNYTKDAIKHFSLERQIRVIDEALQKFGIDIFANRNYDTWVLLEIESRLSNNAWSDAIVDCLSPLFCMINHSCDPNLIWRTQDNHQTLKIHAKKAIKEGEQFFIEYDQYQHNQPLEVRRGRLENWFGHDCQCTRCMREEAAQQDEIRKILEKQGLGHINKIVDGSGLSLEALGKAWDTSEPVELPEDCIIGGKWAQMGEVAAEKKKKRRAHKKKGAGAW